MYSILQVRVALLLSLIFYAGASLGAQDFDLKVASQGVIKLTVNQIGGREKIINGVVVSPTVIVTTREAVEGFSPEITIQGDRATLSRQFSDQNLALISYPRGGLTPVTFAASMGEEGRNIHFVIKGEAGTESVSGAIVNLVSENTRRGGYFDGSTATALINLRQAAVFNNCGELVGLFDKSVNSSVSVVKGLDDLTGVAIATARHKISDQVCPSESDKRRIREEQAKQEAADKAVQAAKALEDAEAAARAEREALRDESEALLKKAEEALRDESEAALKKAEEEAKAKAVTAEQEGEKQRLEAEAKLLQIEEEAEKRQADADIALKQLEEVAKLKEEEAALLVKEQQRDYLIVLVVLVVLVLAIFIPMRRRKKKLEEESDETHDPDFNESGSDVIIRGSGFTIKVPEELLIRERGVLIGRSAADCDFVVDAPSISRVHIRLNQKEQILYVEDLGSANGTMLNGLRLQSGQPVALHDKDDLVLADSLSVVEVRRR